MLGHLHVFLSVEKLPNIELLTRAQSFLCSILFLVFGQIAVAQNAAIIGAESLANDCARASEVASSTGNANRQALEDCDRAILEGRLKQKDLVASYVNRGVVYMAMGKPKLALNDINRALSMDSNTGEAYVNRGNLWFLGLKLENAIADYDKAIDLGVGKPHVAHLNRAMALEQLGHLERSKADYQQALLYREGWPQAQTRLERVLKMLEQNKTNKSIEHIESSVTE